MYRTDVEAAASDSANSDFPDLTPPITRTVCGCGADMFRTLWRPPWRRPPHTRPRGGRRDADMSRSAALLGADRSDPESPRGADMSRSARHLATDYACQARPRPSTAP